MVIQEKQVGHLEIWIYSVMFGQQLGHTEAFYLNAVDIHCKKHISYGIAYR
jgi:hypothetical protein